MVLAEGRREGVRITVSDSGIGIAPEQQERVFSPFNREDEGVGSSRGGLGLALVRRYVTLHGGTEALPSEGGSGTPVTLALPQHPRPASTTSPAPSRYAHSTRGTPAAPPRAGPEATAAGKHD